MAAVFCMLYISKPVIASTVAPATLLETVETSTESPALVTSEESPRQPAAIEPQHISTKQGEPFEETNLRIQHILGAAGPQGEDLGRITLDVPVLYQSGKVRWTHEDVTKARSLLSRLESYQTRSRELRDEAVTLISEWDDLIVHSIPEQTLRADSPTLPENQGVGSADAAPLRSTEAIQINH